MNGFQVRYWLLVLIAVVVWLLLAFRRRYAPSTYVTCDQLFADIRGHIVPNAFDNRRETFVGIWGSSSARDREVCSYYSFHGRENYLNLGLRKPSGEYSRQVVSFSKGEDGVISYFPPNDPSNILGYIYPVFFDDYLPALGIVQCTENNGYAEWKSSVAVPLLVLHHPLTDVTVQRGVERFQSVAAQLGVDLHEGDAYRELCWKSPIWNLDLKRKVTEAETT